MNNYNHSEQVVKDIALLYELALTSGQSLDIHETCDLFLKRLMIRKNFAYSAVWIKDDPAQKKEDNTASLIYSFPETMSQVNVINLENALLNLSPETGFTVSSPTVEPFASFFTENSLEKGFLILYPLIDIGFLILVSTKTDRAIYGEMEQLQLVIKNFAVTLKGCLAHSRLLAETRDREKAVHDLKLNEERFSNAQLFAGMGTWKYDPEKDIFQWSKECATLFGLENADFKSPFESFLKMIHPEDRVNVIRINQPILESKKGIPLCYEHRIIRKDGTVRWVREEAGPVTGEDGNNSTIVGMIIDITEQKEAEEEIRNLADEQDLLLNNIDIQVWYLTDVQTYGAVNEAHAAFFGLKKEDLHYKSLWSILHNKEEVLECIEGNKRVFEEKKQIKTEEWIVNGLGEKRVLSITKSPKLDAKGNVRYVICSASDITEQKKTKNALENTNKQLRGILESQHDLIVRVNIDGLFLYVNDAYCRKFGRSRAELIGSSFTPLVHLDDLEPTLTAMEGLYHPPHRIYIEQRALTVDGWRWIAWEDSAIFDDKGNVVEIQGVGRDITDRKMAEAALQKAHAELEKRVDERTADLQKLNEALQKEVSERKKAETALADEKEFLNVTLQSIGDGVVITDNEGIITLVNPEAEIITGRCEAEVKGKPLSSLLALVGERQPITCDDPLSLIMQEKDKNEINDLILTTASGIKKIVYLNGALIKDAGNKPLGYVITFKDITKLRRAEERLALTRKLESIGKLTAGIAHEITTPMQYISDNTRFIKKTYEDMKNLWTLNQQLAKDIQDREYEIALVKIREIQDQFDIDYYLKEIPQALEETLEGIDRISRLLGSMKSLSHSSSGIKTSIDLNKAIEDTVNITRNEWKNNAALKLNLAPDLPSVKCNLDEITQVLLNMIINASHAVSQAANPKGLNKGEIVITTGRENDIIKITISDNGTGIPKKFLNQVFDPFFTTKDIGKGSGQGLMLAYDIIVNKHGGDISVQSEEGVGTVFTIILPACI